MGVLGTSSYSAYKKLVKNAKWVCRSCGRSAASPKSLCNPKKL
jgi:rubrerythrin